MSDPDAGTSGAAADDDASGHGHEAPSEPLGPVDKRAWGMAIIGGGVGLLVALALLAVTQG